MSKEEAKEPTEVKKKGKLPIVIALVVLIAGGGFFGMKMKGGGAPKKVVIKSAPEAVAMDKEFLVNLSGGANTYLRAEIAFELREGFKKEDIDAQLPAVRNAINQILRSKTLQDVSSGQTTNLQKQIGEAVNVILISHMKDEEKKAQEEFEKAAHEGSDTKSKSEDSKDDGKKDDAGKSEKGETFECPAGPVLNVYFTSFTTQ